MVNTSLCYIEKDGCYLMLHRIKKENDVNEGKWVGIGGKFKNNETPEQCCIREVKEETGLTIYNLKYRGIVQFASDTWPSEKMHLFTATTDFDGALPDCNEGVLQWIPIQEVSSLPIWEGDKIFLEYLNSNLPFFNLQLVYSGDKLIDSFIK